MKKVFSLLTIVCSITYIHAQTTCNDLGVENGWGNWKWRTGTNSGANPPVFSGLPVSNPANAASGYYITSGSGIDINTPGPNAGNPTIPIVCPGFGNHSIMIGDSCHVGSIVQQLTYSFIVTPQDTNFVFANAMVIENSEASLPNGAPFCEIVIYDSLGNYASCTPIIYFPGSNIPGLYNISGNGCAVAGYDQYKPWTITGINLSLYIGQKVSVEITNADCIYAGHFAYSYWDFQCKPFGPEYCGGNQITLCAAFDPNINYTYQWYQNGTTLSNSTGQCFTVTPNANDTFMVHVKQTSACNFYELFVPVDTCLTSVNNFSTSNRIKIFPNSFFTQTTLHSDIPLRNATITIENCFGQIVSEIKNINGEEVILNRNNLPSGIYFLHLTDGNKIYYEKLIMTDK